MIHREGLSFYLDKLRSGEPFSSYLWGDGEFAVAARQRTGRTMQNGEVVTIQLEDELRAALAIDEPNVLHATDPFLAEPWTYAGNDKHSVNSIAAMVPPHRDWYDGTIWDTASREGTLGPLLKVLNERKVVFIGNNALLKARPFEYGVWIRVPDTNACSHNFEPPFKWDCFQNDLVFVACMGISAIPTLARIRRLRPGCTFLDLGSTFDVFAKIGAERGWRQELYRDEQRWQELIAKHREGA